MGLFDFFRKSKEARPIFEVLGTDMHNHLVPNVDDGSKSIEETLQCLKTLQSVGYKKAYITPHFQSPRFPNTEEDILQRYAEVKEVAQNAGLDIELLGAGGEYRLDGGFVERVQPRKLLTFGNNIASDKGYLLVELSMHQNVPRVELIMEAMQDRGYNVVLAHPERYAYLNIDGMFMEKIKKMGVLLQVNVLSLDGFYGPVPMQRGYELIERGWVELLGTDTHNMLYGQALINASRNKKIERILEKHIFLNSDL